MAVNKTIFSPATLLLGEVDAVERAIHEILVKQFALAVAHPDGIQILLLITPDRAESRPGGAVGKEMISPHDAGPVVGIELNIADLSVLAAAPDRNTDAQRRPRQVVNIMPVTALGPEIQELVRVAAVDVNYIEVSSLALDQEGIFFPTADCLVWIVEGETAQTGAGEERNAGILVGPRIDVQHAAAPDG